MESREASAGFRGLEDEISEIGRVGAKFFIVPQETFNLARLINFTTHGLLTQFPRHPISKLKPA